MLNDYLALLVLIMLVLLGMLFSKLKWFNDSVSNFILNVLINVTIPSLLIYSILHDFSKEEFFNIVKISYIPILIMVVMYIISFIIALIFKVDKKRRGSFMNNASLQSILFFSMPVIIGILGTKYLPLILICYLCQTLIYWSYSIYLFQKDHEYMYNQKIKTNLLENLKKIINLPLIGFVVGVILLMLGIQLPSFLDKFLSYNANLTIPLAMFQVGSIIYSTGIKTLKLTRDTVLVLILRYIAAFFIVLLICHIFNVDNQLTKVFLLIFVAPAINLSIIIAKKYQIDYQFTTQAIVYTIFAYVLVLPILIFILRFI